MFHPGTRDGAVVSDGGVGEVAQSRAFEQQPASLVGAFIGKKYTCFSLQAG